MSALARSPNERANCKCKGMSVDEIELGNLSVLMSLQKGVAVTVLVLTSPGYI